MIRDYSDHAANERTFLAWLRTGIAVIAFGFVIEKFNLFALTVLNATPLREKVHAQLERYSGPFGLASCRIRARHPSRFGLLGYLRRHHAGREHLPEG